MRSIFFEIASIAAILGCFPAVSSTLRVKIDAPGPAHDGSTWDTAYLSIGDAANRASSGDEIWVARGVYYETATVTIRAGVGLYGGFTGSETALSNRDVHTYTSVIDGGTKQDVVHAWQDECTIDGFTIRRGLKGISIIADGVAISNCSIASNTAGGVYLDGTATISCCQILSNSKSTDGAGVCAQYGSATIVNSIIAHNTAGQTGGGLYASTRTTLVNCTIAYNAAPAGGAIQATSGLLTMTNCIAASNIPGLLFSASNAVFSNNDFYSNTAYNFSGVTDPTGTSGNISKDPLFANTGTDFHIKATSPCVEGGLNSVVVGTTDVYGKPRINGMNVDIGADENDGTVGPLAVFYVSPTGNSANSGRSWAQALNSVFDALSRNPVGEIWVAAGTYPGNFTLVLGTRLYGGFAGNETVRGQRNPTVNQTILDGNSSGSVVTIGSDATPATVLDGFTIRNGRGTEALAYWTTMPPCEPHGGQPLIDFYTHLGGGVYSPGGSPVIAHNIIEGNRTDYHSTDPFPSCGGWVFLSGPGGGVYAGGSPTIVGNVIRSNAGGANQYLSEGGGGICLVGGYPVLKDNLIYDNTMLGDGGGLWVSAFPILINNTIVNNTATGSGNGIEYAFCTAVTSSNNILASKDVYLYLTPASAITSSHDFTTGDPLFIDAGNGNYHLKAGSPCIDAGDDTAVSKGDTDLVGRPRILGEHVDIGCYESPPVYSAADALKALKIAAGLTTASPTDAAALDLATGASAGKIDLLDAVAVLRKATGLDR